jgi:hypothetical protein
MLERVVKNWKIVRRVLIAMALGIAIAVGVNEGSFVFLKSEAGRAPRDIELVIPAGTAERIAQGSGSSMIPEGMVFVVGDTLIVKNEDSVDHRLGPLFIPVGTSARMNLSEASNFTYECSFQPTQYFGLDVREPVTWSIRLYGILFAGIPLGTLLALYSFLIWPLKPREKAAA